MDVVSTGPLRTASLLWQSRADTSTLTVVCKATFRLQPDESPLADDQDVVNEEDTFWNDDRSRSVYAPNDLVPFKRRADVLLVGSAFAPRKEPVRSLVARLIVADIDKSIEVFGERTLTRDGQLREGFPFAKMPVRYERAAGGPETSNPVGMRVDGQSGPQGTIQLPNLQPRVLSMTGSDQDIPPVGFGPLASSWPSRLAMLGRHAGAWPMPGWSERALPEDISSGYFNAAPIDQQLDAIRETERILLENLHPDHPRLVTALPGLRPRAMIERPGANAEELRLKADTLWIDTDRSVCSVTWRAQVPLRHRGEAGRVIVSVDQPVARLLRGALQTHVDRLSPAPSPSAARVSTRPSAMPFTDARVDTGERAAPRPEAPAVKPRDEIKAPAQDLDFLDGARSGASAPEEEGEREVVSARDLTALEPLDLGAEGPPTTASPGPVAPTSQRPPPPPARPRRATPSVMEMAAAASRSARSSGDGEPDAVTPPRPSAKARPNAREVVKLVWVDPKSMARLREERRWRTLLGPPAPRSMGSEDDDRATGEGGASPKDRRDVLTLLARGEALREGGVKHWVTDAIGEDGTLEPPLVLVAGELELPFDELAALKATVTAASPLAAADEGLQEALAMASDLLKSQWPPGSGGLAAGLLSRLKNALAQAGRAPGGSMDAHTDRMLLEQRSYQWRTVFGRRWIRGLLRASAGATEVTTVYLPEALRDELPLFRRLRVRLIGEADLREDEAEPSGCAIKVMALARVADLP